MSRKKIKVGDDVIVLHGYDVIPGKCLKVNAKSIKVQPCPPSNQHFRHLFRVFPPQNYKVEKVAHVDDQVAIIWEAWKGVNGRGGYRIEFDRHEQYHLPAKKWVEFRTSEFLEESEEGVVCPLFIKWIRRGGHKIFSK